ncbi:MAG: hypothetical protein FWG07_11650 [Treponema sp.]|nr:hypothetical protein [Treponema sp.]
MRGLFENIQFLIPLALIIAVQVIRARNAQDKKQQKKTGGLGELIKKIQEAQQNPEYGKALTEATEVYIPPKPQQQPRAARKPISKHVRPPARPVEAKRVHKSSVKTQFSQNEATGYGKLSSEEKSNIDSVTTAQVKPVAQQSLQTGLSLQGLTPLQQAIVWSEILGPPKGVSIS